MSTTFSREAASGRSFTHEPPVAVGSPNVLPCPYTYEEEEIDVHGKDEGAARLIAWHFRIEPELRAIYRIISSNEDVAGEPIKLLG
jgi:hypothetical protein